jgi:hypothetical protein
MKIRQPKDGKPQVRPKLLKVTFVTLSQLLTSG